MGKKDKKEKDKDKDKNKEKDKDKEKTGKFLLILTTVPDEEKGKEIARRLVERKLAACVNISPAVRSTYWWEGKISEDKEHILFIKTREQLFEALEQEVASLHPYSVPELIAFKIKKASSPYLAWLDSVTAGGDPDTKG